MECKPFSAIKEPGMIQSANPEDTRQVMAPFTASPMPSLPPPPEPGTASHSSQDKEIATSLTNLTDVPLLHLDCETWDITSITSCAALGMLIDAVQMLAEATGDVPPTPPVSRPSTPSKELDAYRHTPSPNEAPDAMPIGSPEAHPREPIAVQVGAGAEEISLQRIAIARRFFSKTAPSFSLSDYLRRLHHYCPHSPGVYLTAALYCHRLCVTDLAVPATNRTIHRLCLAAIRVAAKALEDNKWPQNHFAAIGGVSRIQLMNLELTLCYLLDFELGVGPSTLARSMFLLQQAARQERSTKGRLSEGFKLRLPSHRRKMLTRS